MNNNEPSNTFTYILLFKYWLECSMRGYFRFLLWSCDSQAWWGKSLATAWRGGWCLAGMKCNFNFHFCIESNSWISPIYKYIISFTHALNTQNAIFSIFATTKTWTDHPPKKSPDCGNFKKLPNGGRFVVLSHFVSVVVGRKMLCRLIHLLFIIESAKLI